MTSPSAAQTPPPAICLRVEGLKKRFGDLVAVDGLSLEVRAGEVFGLLGPNGAGKTTSINMMCGLLRPDAGHTYLLGKPTNGDDPELRARVGVCPQSVVIWPRLTCLEQLEFMGEAYCVPRPLARRRAEQLLEAMGLHEKRNKLGKTLSGGMQRRLSIIMALIHEPDVVVLDEPEAGLDPQSRVMVRESIDRLAHQEGKTVIFTTHNMDEAERVVDRVAIMDRGKLLELDTPDALRHRVGGGDTLDLMLSSSGRELTDQERVRLGEAFPTARVNAGHLTLRELAVVDRLPLILDRIKELGLGIDKVQLRPSTLEDVFISLTGRSLRE